MPQGADSRPRAEAINRLDGTAVNLPGGEIMPALQSRVIDATERVGPWNDLAFGFYKITTITARASMSPAPP